MNFAEMNIKWIIIPEHISLIYTRNNTNRQLIPNPIINWEMIKSTMDSVKQYTKENIAPIYHENIMLVFLLKLSEN